MAEIAWIVPATRTGLLDSVLESISRQSRPVAEVIVVLDGGDLEWQSKREGIKILRNARNLGKVKSTLKALSSIKSELVLSVDCDTIVSPNSLERMAEGLKGDIEVVCARIEPLDRST
jgi:cellulose synthase/poly-beta-1,6-N-acetylglucosamine synthase-like glycosyltransferase